MSLSTRKEAAVRELLDGALPAIPPELYAEAVRRGGRMLRRRRTLRRVLWLLLVLLVTAFVIWASVVRPWTQPPSDTTPPLTGL